MLIQLIFGAATLLSKRYSVVGLRVFTRSSDEIRPLALKIVIEKEIAN